MAERSRSTRESSVDGLPAGARDALSGHPSFHNLGPILDELMCCIVTESTKLKKDIFAPGPQKSSVRAAVTPRWLAWLIDGRDGEPAVMSARLEDVTVVDYQNTPSYQLIADSGLEVSGAYPEVMERASAFRSLGDDIPGWDFKEIALKAVQDATK